MAAQKIAGLKFDVMSCFTVVKTQDVSFRCKPTFEFYRTSDLCLIAAKLNDTGKVIQYIPRPNQNRCMIYIMVDIRLWAIDKR